MFFFKPGNEQVREYLMIQIRRVDYAAGSMEPTGVRFFKATQWGSDRIFEK